METPETFKTLVGDNFKITVYLKDEGYGVGTSIHIRVYNKLLPIGDDFIGETYMNLPFIALDLNGNIKRYKG